MEQNIQDENSVRKNYLNSLYFLTAANFFYYCVQSSKLEYGEAPNKYVTIFILAIVLLIGCFISFVLSYYFPYKKRGTKLLMFNLISVPLGIIAFLISDTSLFGLLLGSIGTYFWWTSLQLYKINSAQKKALKKQKA